MKLKLVEEKPFFERFLERATMVFLLLLAGAALGYWWAVSAYGVLK